jgi:hypothetical protein
MTQYQCRENDKKALINALNERVLSGPYNFNIKIAYVTDLVIQHKHYKIKGINNSVI